MKTHANGESYFLSADSWDIYFFHLKVLSSTDIPSRPDFIFTNTDIILNFITFLLILSILDYCFKLHSLNGHKNVNAQEHMTGMHSGVVGGKEKGRKEKKKKNKRKELETCI